jgi:hypothetical protein
MHKLGALARASFILQFSNAFLDWHTITCHKTGLDQPHWFTNTATRLLDMVSDDMRVFGLLDDCTRPNSPQVPPVRVGDTHSAEFVVPDAGRCGVI